MRNKDLLLLINEYSNATSKEDVLVKLKLEGIESLCSKCNLEEFVFANAITSEFCRLIQLLKEQNEKEIEVIECKYDERYCHANNYQRYVPVGEHRAPYQRGDELLSAFYNYFRKETELEFEAINNYEFASEKEKKEKINLTLMDYVSRIRTFSNKYLWEMFRPDEVWNSGSRDEILFIYENIEHILAKFKTKGENGESIKQRVNIRSALRKLNEYKCMKER